MIADVILRLLGNNPAAYPDTDDKWSAILGILTYYIVPYGQIILFFLPFLAIKLLRKKYTKKNILAALIIGIILAILAYIGDNLFLLYGQDAAFKAIYGI